MLHEEFESHFMISQDFPRITNRFPPKEFVRNIWAARKICQHVLPSGTFRLSLACDQIVVMWWNFRVGEEVLVSFDKVHNPWRIHGTGTFTHTWMMDFYGKCIVIYNTWMLWVICKNIMHLKDQNRWDKRVMTNFLLVLHGLWLPMSSLEKHSWVLYILGEMMKFDSYFSIGYRPTPKQVVLFCCLNLDHGFFIAFHR